MIIMMMIIMMRRIASGTNLVQRSCQSRSLLSQVDTKALAVYNG